MKRLLFATIFALPLAGCISMQVWGSASTCTPKWPSEFASRLAAEADALPADAATREALAQLVEIRRALPRC